MSAAIEIYAGDSKTITLTVLDADGDAVDLTGADVFFAVANEPGATAFIEKSVGSGVTLTDPTNGVATIAIDPSDTVSVTPSDYFYDVRVELSTGDRNTVVAPSTFRILQPLGGFDAVPSDLTAKQQVKLGVTGPVWETLATFAEGSTADTADLGGGRLRVRVNASGTARVTMVFDLETTAVTSFSRYQCAAFIEYPTGSSDDIRCSAGIAFDAGSASYAETLAARLVNAPTFTDKAVTAALREEDSSTSYFARYRKFFTSPSGPSGGETAVVQPGPIKIMLEAGMPLLSSTGGSTDLGSTHSAQTQVAESSPVGEQGAFNPFSVVDSNYGRARLFLQFEAINGTTDHDFVIQTVEGGVSLA